MGPVSLDKMVDNFISFDETVDKLDAHWEKLFTKGLFEQDQKFNEVAINLMSKMKSDPRSFWKTVKAAKGIRPKYLPSILKNCHEHGFIEIGGH